MGPADAVRPIPGGVRIDVEVVPGADRAGFPTGYNPWRKRVQARLEAPPADGAANRELVQRVAAAFGVPAAAVALVSGSASRQKSVAVHGVDVALALLVVGGTEAAP